MIDFSGIGRRIREERKLNRRCTQEQMAADLNMYQADISNLERALKGSGINDLYRLDRLAEYFGIPTQELIFGSNNDKMIRYKDDPKNIIKIKAKAPIPEAHIKILSALYGTEDMPMQDLQGLVVRFKYGPYITYFCHRRPVAQNTPDP